MSNESLTRAYELTRTLVAALDAGDFAFAADLAEERSPLLMSLEREQTDEDLALIREIMALNESIAGKASAARDAIVASHSEARQRVSAARQYLSTGQIR
ncbi:flagellar protein FliT [Trinickia sp.]|uniref:flagellar protein FliT n=1 Tax=Trinickia sp. TaxID=2571163 RepID=UPI003F7CE360